MPLLRLRDLDAHLIRREVREEAYSRLRPDVIVPPGPFHRPFTEEDFEEVVGPREHWVTVDTIAEADGIRFVCPKCYNDPPVGREGAHSIVCWFVGKVADHVEPKPGRWIPSGSGIDDLTFAGPNSASVALTGGCMAHFFVRNGAIEMA